METASEPIEPRLDGLDLSPASTTVVGAPARVRVRRSRRARERSLTAVVARQEVLWITTMYLAARGLLLLVAYLNGAFGHHNFLHELANWDGLWYRELANHGYPTHVSYGQTTLGFFPLFPLTIWVVKQPLLLLTVHNDIWCSTVAGALVSAAGGLVATVLVYRLTEGWWGRSVARRATLLFIIFPGSVVFSMVYSEGILMPLAVGCIYMLQRRRWVAAGLLAGFATAVQPVSFVLPVVCGVSALVALYRSRGRELRALAAPLLSVTGLAAFAGFLWLWTGNPLANYLAQHHGWSEKTDPLALVHLTTQLASEVSFTHFNEPTINLNLVVGLIGAFVLAAELVLVWRSRREISVEALVWTLGVSFLALTSEKVPPNPRMLITAFPALIVIARWASDRWFAVIVWINGILFVALSLVTFYGLTLRP